MLLGIIGCESREEARRRQAANNLKQIGLAVEAYHAKYAEQILQEESDSTDTPPVTVAPGTAENSRDADQSTPQLPE